MSTGKIIWDKPSEHYFETGVDRVVLYPWVPKTSSSAGHYGDGVAWNGITAISESPSGAEASALYADNTKYLNLMSNEEFGGTIEAYTYPDEFAKCDGSALIANGVKIGMQKRIPFAFTYRTRLGNDDEGDSFGHKLHIVYGCLASPSEKSRSTVNESPEAMTFSWTFTTTPVEVEGFKPTAHVEIDSTKADPEALKKLENMLYGTDAGEGGTPEATAPTLALPADIVTIFKASTSSVVAG